MADELIKVNTLAYTGAAVKLQKVAPKAERALRKTIRADAVPLGKSMTAGLAPGDAYHNGMGERLRRGNYTKLRFLREGAGVQMTLRLGFRHPVYADPDKTRAEWSWVNQPLPEREAPLAFDKGVDKLQNDIANAYTKALKENL